MRQRIGGDDDCSVEDVRPRLEMHGELFEKDGEIGATAAHSAILFRDRQAEPTLRRELFIKLDGKALLLVAATNILDRAFPRQEGAKVVAHQALLVADFEVHEDFPVGYAMGGG
jgi:hypothetical protein